MYSSVRRLKGHDTPSFPTNSQAYILPAELTSDDVIDIYFEYPGFPQQPTNISERWARYLNPLTDDLNSCLVNVLMQQQVFPQESHISASLILATLILNSPARTSWNSVL